LALFKSRLSSHVAP